jgi:hypothetical protein
MELRVARELLGWDGHKAVARAKKSPGVASLWRVSVGRRPSVKWFPQSVPAVSAVGSEAEGRPQHNGWSHSATNTIELGHQNSSWDLFVEQK